MIETQELKTNTKLIPPKDIEFISVEVEDWKTLNSMVKHFEDKNSHHETVEGIAWSLFAAFLSSYIIYVIQYKDDANKLFWVTVCHIVLVIASLIIAFIFGKKVKKQKTITIITKKCIQDLLKSITEKTNLNEKKKMSKANGTKQQNVTPSESTVPPAFEAEGEHQNDND